VMVGSASDPAIVASITLTARSAGGAGEAIANANQPSQQYAPPERAQIAPGQIAPGMGPGGPVVQPPANDEEADAEDADAEENADQDQAGGTPSPTAQDGSQQPPNGGPKTPEQILEMLRQHQGTPPGQVRPPQMPPPNQQPPDNNND